MARVSAAPCDNTAEFARTIAHVPPRCEMAFTVIGLGGPAKSTFGSEVLEDAMARAAPILVQEPQTIRCVGLLVISQGRST